MSVRFRIVPRGRQSAAYASLFCALALCVFPAGAADTGSAAGPASSPGALPAGSARALWSRALPGAPLSDPVPDDDRVYIACADRSVVCLSESGSFLWSRTVRGKVLPFISVSPSGMVFASSEPGAVSAFNRDGSLVWTLKSGTPPILAPRIGRDGRLFIVFDSSVACVSATGAVKWTLPLDVRPAPPLSETADGDLLVGTAAGPLLRISPFGELLERIQVPEPVSCLLPVPGGFVSAGKSGVIRAWDVRSRRREAMRESSDAVWEYDVRSGVSALALGGGTLLAAGENGVLRGLNVTDGSVLWSSSLGFPVPPGSGLAYDYGRFNITLPGHFASRSVDGTSGPDAAFPVYSGRPALSPGGIVYVPSSDWALHAYRAETRVKTEKKSHKYANYGILKGIDTDFARDAFIGAVFDSVGVSLFFEDVSRAIRAGTVGTSEPAWARQLVRILADKPARFPFPARDSGYDETERARAASLLGKLGSEEYREPLLASAGSDFDSGRAIGVLYGLSALGPDPDGRTIGAVRQIVRAAGPERPDVLMAACDTLYAIARYSAGTVALDATRFLAEFLESPYQGRVQNYARQLMGNILH